MDFDAFKASLHKVKKHFADAQGLVWGRPRLQPKYDPISGDLLGWDSVVVVKFEASQEFIRLMESWKLTKGSFRRAFFSYHYGPYKPEWDLETVVCKSVTARVDGQDYSGRGYHLHDGAKESRIFQDELASPDLEKTGMIDFVESILQLRYGKSLFDAFGVKMK